MKQYPLIPSGSQHQEKLISGSYRQCIWQQIYVRSPYYTQISKLMRSNNRYSMYCISIFMPRGTNDTSIVYPFKRTSTIFSLIEQCVIKQNK